MSRFTFLFLACALGIVNTAEAQCSASGLTLAADGGRIGDDVTIELAGSPLVPGFVGVDFGGGPVITPFGTVCLSLSAQVLTLPFALNPLGALSFDVPMPPDPALQGLTIHLQAAAIDPVQPLGVALSNDDTLAPFPPRVYALQRGSPFFPPPEAKIIYVDALADVQDFGFDLGKPALVFLFVPAMDCIAILFEDGELRCVDAETGATVASLALPPANPGSLLRLSELPTAIFVADVGQPFGVPTLSLVDLATGTTLASSPGFLPPVLLVPGTTEGIFAIANGFARIDYVTGAIAWSSTLSTAHGPLAAQFLDAGRLIVLSMGVDLGFGGFVVPAIQTADLATGAVALPFPLFPSPLSVARVIRKGPGPSGDAFYVTFISGEILTLSPSTFAVLGSTATTLGIQGMRLSSGGTEWLLLQVQGGLPARVWVLDPTTLVATPKVTLSGSLGTLVGHGLLPLPSDSLRKAYVLSTDQDQVFTFDTDPTTGATSTIPITQLVGQLQFFSN